MGLLFVFMAVMPSFRAFADNNQTCDGRIENYVSATGTVAQNGTPSPTNPIEPVFYKQGDMVLRKVGDIADSYDATTGKITRRVGVRVFTGNENIYYEPAYRNFIIGGMGMLSAQYNTVKIVSTHFKQVGYNPTNVDGVGFIYYKDVFLRYQEYDNDLSGFKQWLSQQYADGTPVTVYYPLAEAVEETVGTTYCADAIKIATTAYNAARFNPVKTDLDSAVATIREIVTKTINQTAAIASLQADKQTRPEDACPAGKKCLLVETEENGVIVPHWFPIIEAPEDN